MNLSHSQRGNRHTPGASRGAAEAKACRSWAPAACWLAALVLAVANLVAAPLRAEDDTDRGARELTHAEPEAPDLQAWIDEQVAAGAALAVAAVRW